MPLGKTFELVNPFPLWKICTNSDLFLTFDPDLMTGEDMDQVVLTNIAENVNSDAMKYKYTVPEVAPHAPIYFLMFTSGK
jgi:hypothetical protein